MCFNSIIGRLLKMYFAIPLNPALHINDYSFPSGHTLAAATFYGYLAYCLHNKATYLLYTLLICGISYGLIHHGYHDIYDISAAILLALLTIPCYYSYLHQQHNLAWLIIFGIIINCYMPTANVPITKIQHIWLNIGFLFGVYHTQIIKADQQKKDMHISSSIHSILGAIFYYLGILIHEQICTVPFLLFIPSYIFSYWALSTSQRPKLQQKIQALYNSITSRLYYV